MFVDLLRMLRRSTPTTKDIRASVSTLIDAALTMAELAGADPDYTPVDRGTFRSIHRFLGRVQLVIHANRCEEGITQLQSIEEIILEDLRSDAMHKEDLKWKQL